MGVEETQAAQRILIHDLGVLKREVSRAMDAAQLGQKPAMSDELKESWDRVQRARLIVIRTIEEHDA